MKIYFIRHAHVAYDTELGNRYKVEHYKEHLTPLGWAQALELDYLLDQSKIQFEAIYSSDYCRAVETIVPFSARTKLSIKETAFLRELQVKGKSADFLKMAKQDFNYRNFGGESINEASARLKGFITSLSSQHSATASLILVTHGILLQSLFSTVFNRPEIEPTWPDVYSVGLQGDNFVNLKQETDLVPFNNTKHDRLNLYPEFK
ncbi:MAG: histidine phosphatase family protein [Patescibacteria group bacterium]